MSSASPSPAAPAAAQEATSFTLLAHSDGGGGYFTLEGQTARNPTLNVAANTEITLVIKAADGDGVHNVCVGTTCSEFVQATDETQTITVNSGAATQDYFCQPHKGAGMLGKLAVAGSAVTEEKGSPGVQVLGVALAMLGAALVMGRRSK